MDPLQLQELNDRISSLEGRMGTHLHSGFDTTRIRWSDLDSRIIYVSHTIQGTAAATGTNYNTFFIVPAPLLLISFQEVHATAGSDGGAVTMTLEKLTGTTASGGGTGMIASALSLKATANTVQNPAVSTTSSSKTLAAGDRLALLTTGVLTAVANVTVLVTLQMI